MEQTLMMPRSVNTTSAAPHLSKKYVHVNSAEIIKMMTDEGFRLASARSSQARRRSAEEFSRHALDFRFPDAPQIGNGEGEPRVLFVNSHDGSSAATVMAGVYRFVCENGLVIGSDYARERVRHSGQQARDFVKRMQELARNTAPLFRQIDTWSKTPMSRTNQHNFARLAATLRFGDPGRFAAADLLRARRGEDEGDSVWRVFNRVQENIVRGGLEGVSANGQAVISRPLNAVNSELRFNEQLWKLAEDFAKI